MDGLVLIVDDDPHFRLFADKALSARGLTVETRESAFGLVNRVCGFDADGTAVRKPDVVLIDHMMPGLEGGDSIRLLAANAGARAVPVVLVSAGERDVLEAAAAQHPRCRFVPKVGRMSAVVDAVTEALAQSASADRKAAG